MSQSHLSFLVATVICLGCGAAPGANATPMEATVVSMPSSRMAQGVARGDGLRTRLSGCLASQATWRSGSVDSGDPTAPPMEPAVTVQTSGPRLVVRHAFQHPCCVHLESEISVENATVSIVERLVGPPCRCLCHSTVIHDGRLPVGRWQIEVVLHPVNAPAQTLHVDTVDIQPIRAN